ncbi:hypothetical protein BDV97DRAFT_387509 [Delphinella strobiligena]|nr:hypothetical protein BDV97DRAFT_387509 [Delphinella strobiligena]
MAASLFDLTRNFSYYTVPAVWVLSIAPHFYAAKLAGNKFDNRNPRGLKEVLAADQTLDQSTKGRIIRAESAQQNGFENIGLYAAAVVAANHAGVDNWTLNALSGGYVFSRLAYNLIYVNNETEALANARSVSFLSGIGIIFTLFIKAGNAVRGHL